MKIAQICIFILFYIQGKAILEPEDGKVYFGAYLDTEDRHGVEGDRPLKFNQRMGFNASFFQYSQEMPSGK